MWRTEKRNFLSHGNQIRWWRRFSQLDPSKGLSCRPERIRIKLKTSRLSVGLIYFSSSGKDFKHIQTRHDVTDISTTIKLMAKKRNKTPTTKRKKKNIIAPVSELVLQGTGSGDSITWLHLTRNLVSDCNGSTVAWLSATDWNVCSVWRPCGFFLCLFLSWSGEWSASAINLFFFFLFPLEINLIWMRLT